MDRTLINVNSDNVEIVFDPFSNESLVNSGSSETVNRPVNPYNPGVLFMGHRPTESPQM